MDECQNVPSQRIALVLGWAAALFMLCSCESEKLKEPSGPMNTGGTGGASGASGSSGVGGAGTSGAGGAGNGGDPSTGGRNPPPLCETQGRRFAILSGPIDGSPFELDEVAQFTSDVVFDSLRFQQGMSGLTLHGGGFFINLTDGFWDVTWGAEPAWYASRPEHGALPAFLHGDLDADDIDDVISFGWLADDDGGNEQDVITLWKRTEDGLDPRSTTRLARPIGAPPNFRARLETHALGDIDGDGDLDIVTFREGAPRVQRNEGDFTLSALEPLGDPEAGLSDHHTVAIDLRDRDDDGDLDLLAVLLRDMPSQARVVVLVGDGSGGFDLASNEPITGVTPTRSQFGDLDGDGVFDLFLERITGNEQLFFLVPGVSASSFGEPVPLDLGANSVRVSDVIDLDGDGVSEIVLHTEYELVLLRSMGSGQLDRTALRTRGSGLFRGVILAPPTEEEPARVHVVLQLGCPGACGPDDCDGRCVFDECVMCLTDAECPGAYCGPTGCVADAPP